MDTTSNRIKRLRLKLNYTQLQLANVAGISKAAVSQWERDLTRPDWTALRKMRDKMNINPDWVMEGKGAMFVVDSVFYAKKDDATKSREVREPKANLYSSDEKVLIEKYRKLSSADKNRLKKIISALASELDSENK